MERRRMVAGLDYGRSRGLKGLGGVEGDRQMQGGWMLGGARAKPGLGGGAGSGSGAGRDRVDGGWIRGILTESGGGAARAEVQAARGDAESRKLGGAGLGRASSGYGTEEGRSEEGRDRRREWWPKWGARNFCETRKKLVMPCFLTLVFKHFGVSLDGFESKKNTGHVSLSTMKRISARNMRSSEKKRARTLEVEESDEGEQHSRQQSSLRHLEVQVKNMHGSIKHLRSQVKNYFRQIKATLKALCTACGAPSPPRSPPRSAKGKNIITDSDSDYAEVVPSSDSD